MAKPKTEIEMLKEIIETRDIMLKDMGYNLKVQALQIENIRNTMALMQISITELQRPKENAANNIKPHY